MGPLRRSRRDYTKIIWIGLAVILVLLPLIAVGKLIVATDDELDNITAQSLIDFRIVDRTVAGVTYDAAVLKLNALLYICNVYFNQMKLGYWDGTDWDISIDRGNRGLVFGGRGYPVYMRGFRIELAFDDLTAANPNFMFLRLGTDDFSGCLELDPTNSSRGAIDRVSMDGKIHSNASLWPNGGPTIIDINQHGLTQASVMGIAVDANNILTLYYNCGPDVSSASGYQTTGRTDWYISIADAIYNGSSWNNAAFNPGYAGYTFADSIPGRGYWMHFQALYARATLDGVIW